MTEINRSMFRGYDIRGFIGKDLSEEVMHLLGKAYATFLYRRQIRECVVGADMRETSESYKKAFVDGLLKSGIDVTDFGLSLTQIMYFAQYHYLSKGGAMITASHNGPEFNGLKLAVGFSDTLVTTEIEELYNIAQKGAFESWGVPGIYRQDNVFPSYKKDLFKRVQLHDVGLKVVIDSCRATTGKFLPEILRTAGCTVIEQNTDLDPTMSLGTPDPTESAVLSRLAKRVIEDKADIGFTYDSDGDRMGVVDHNGTLIWNDVLVALFAKDILDYLPGSPIVFNALCSKATIEAIEQAGGKPVMWKVGHSFIKQKVREVRAPFGGELSGHFFFMDNFYGHDDGAFSTLRLLQYLARTKQSLAQAVDSLPKYVSSPEIKLGLSDDIKFAFVQNQLTHVVETIFPDATYTDIDGIRADTKTEMMIIRGSQNGPYITIKFEAKEEERYTALKKQIKEQLSVFPEIEWDKGVNLDAFE